MTNVTSWYQFLLQQLVAECYLEGLEDLSPNLLLRQRLQAGNNRFVSGGIPPGLTRPTEKQIDEIFIKVDIVHQWSDNPNRTGNLLPGMPGYLELDGNQILANSGFSATLTKNIDPDSYEFGKFTLSIRSTEYQDAKDGGDYERDVSGTDWGSIAQKGIALAQLDALDRYVQWLQNTPNHLPAGEKFNITGYSLGGHLATLFTELHPELVLHTYTFNGAGRGEWSQTIGSLNEVLEFYRNVLVNPVVAIAYSGLPDLSPKFAAALLDPTVDPVSLYGSARYEWALAATSVRFGLYGTGLFLPLTDPDRIGLTNGAAGLITQIYGHAENGDGEYVSNSGVHGPATGVYIEDQPNVQGWMPGWEKWGFGNTHSLTLLGDSLAVMRLFEKLDPEVDIDALGEIFAAVSNERASANLGIGAEAEGDSLERMVQALGKLVGTNLLTMDVTREATGFADIGNRNDFHQNLSTIFSLLPDGGYRVKSLSGMTRDELVKASKGAEGLAYRYALMNLNTFVAEGTAGGLYDRYKAGGAEAGMLDYDGQGLTGEMSETWIADRAELLLWKMRANKSDQQDDSGTIYMGTGVPLLLEDADSGFKLNAFQSGWTDDEMPLIPTFRKILFGRDENSEAEFLVGGNGVDHLYGEGGDDGLNGAQGDDYLEGGRGDDVLEGGEGDDELRGGKGFDRYIYSTGDGHDVIHDSDRAGRIEIDGFVIAGGVQIGDGSYSDAVHSYQLVGTGADRTLLIDGTLEVKGFSNGDLGIVLRDGQPWEGPADFVTMENGSRVNGGVTTYRDRPGSAGNDLLESFRRAFGAWGDDVISMAPNTSMGLVAGGPGNDLLTASFSGEQQTEYPPNGEYGLVGGSGDDRIIGSASKDQIFGDLRQLEVSLGGSEYLTVKLDYFLFEGFANADTNEFEYDRRFGPDPEEGWVKVESASMVDAFLYSVGMQSAESSTPTYDDYIEGGDGDDVIWAGNGADTVYGGSGNDTIVGDSYGYLLTRWGPDAGYGSWEAFYDRFSGYFPLELLGAAGNDWLEGGEGNDSIEGGNGNDVLIGGSGNDRLVSDEYSRQLAGMNYLDGGEGGDWLESRNLSPGGKDHLVGGEGNDTYVAGSNAGNDWPRGVVEIDDSGGNDSFSIGINAGFHVSIHDTDPTGQDQDSLTINAGIAPVDLSQDWIVKRIGDDLVVEFGPGALASLVIEDWYALEGNRIEMIHVADRFLTGNDHYHHWTADQFEALAQPEYVPHLSGQEGDDELDGWADDDVLNGLGGNDILAGYGGKDHLIGGVGNDVLQGGSGDDFLEGGPGDDTYVYMRGDGVDRIVDRSAAAESNTLNLGPGIDPESVTLGLGSLVIKLDDGGEIHLDSFDPQDPLSVRDIDRFLFADGTVWTYEQLLERGIRIEGTAGDDAIVGTAGVDVIAAGHGDDVIDGKKGNDRIQGGAGSDLYLFGRQSGFDVILDQGIEGEIDAVGLEADVLPEDLELLIQGSDLLLSIPGTESRLRIENWTQAASQVEEIRFADGRIWGVDDILLAASSQNEAPVLVAPLQDSTALEDVASVIFVNRESFMDPDGDSLTFSAGLSHGTGLPDWVTFDPATVSFSVMPRNEHVGNWVVYVTATDPGGEAASGQFSLEIVNVNDVPIPIDDSYSMMEDGTLILDAAMLTGNDTDPDPSGDVLMVVGVEEANGGTAILRADGSVVFTPDPDFSGAAYFQYMVSDQNDGIATAAVHIDIAPVNDAPRLASPLEDVVVQEGVRLDYRLPMPPFTDVDEGDVVSLGARLAVGAGLPAWLTFDAATGTFGGVPAEGSSGSLEIVVSATDSHGSTATDTFVMTINPPPGRSVIGTSRADILTGGSGNDVIDGLAGADRMTGLKGNDTYRVDNAQDLVIESPGEGIDGVLSSVNYVLSANVENLTLTGTQAAYGTGNAADNVIQGNKAANYLKGEAGNDLLRGGEGADYLYGGIGNDEIHGEAGADYLYGDDGKDSLYGEDGADYLYGGKQDDVLHGGAGADYLLGEDGADSLDGGAGADYLYGGAGNDYLLGREDADYLMGETGNDLLVSGSGSDYLYAGQGIDVLQAGDGADYLTAVDGNALLDAGSGSDYLTGGNGAQLLAGGRGNDNLTAGAGADLIAFNKGDGSDIVRPSAGMEDTISLGGGIRYADLTFSRSGSDLVLGAGGTDKITLASWYAGPANRSISQIQVIAEAMPGFAIGSANALLDNCTEVFDFSRLLAAFDASGQVNGWALANALLDAHLFGSDTSAIGGDLAYQYGMKGSFSGIGLGIAQDTLGAGVFGTSPQALHSLNEVQQGTTRLS